MWLKRLNTHHLGTLLIVTILSAPFTSAETVLVHGDSLSAGYGIAVESGWVALMEEALSESTTVINASISGETTQGGLARLDGLLAEHQPTLMVLELGANDGLRGYPLRQMQSNLEAMIEAAQAQGTEVVLIGIRLPPNLGRRYTEPFFNTYRTLAEEYALPYLPFMLEGVAQYTNLMQRDGLHPTAEAQPIILENVLPLVEQSLADNH